MATSFMTTSYNPPPVHVDAERASAIKTCRELSPEALRFVSTDLKNDVLFMIAMIKKDRGALQYADDSLKENAEFVVELVSMHPDLLNYAHSTLMADLTFILRVLKL